MLHIEAMKQALEALEHIDHEDNDRDFLFPYQCTMLDSAITSLRQAIAEAEKQEPHSWYSAQEDEWMTNKIRKEHKRLNSYTHKVGKFDLALYTHPPQSEARGLSQPAQPKREWVGLTDEEILTLIGIHVDDINDIDDWQEEIREVRAIEAKLKEKNT